MNVEKTNFGITYKGIPVHLYSIRNSNGMCAIVTDYGAILISLNVPLPNGALRDVVLGYDSLSEYELGGFLGATVGRHANRISGAAFALGGNEYHLVENDNGANLHSDFRCGFHKQVWDAKLLPDGVRFSRFSPNGECGFPGNLHISVTYTLTESQALVIRYKGVSDQPTLINLTNHSFFNLAGHDSGSVLNHTVQIFCNRFLEIQEGRLPTGRILSVEGTAMDFRIPHSVGDHLHDAWDQLQKAAGYDHCYVTGAQSGSPRLIARVKSPDSVCRMDVYTDLPGVQFYTANYLPTQHGKNGAVYSPRCALCLETGYYPDSIHFPEFPQCAFAAGETYQAETVYHFL